MHSHGFENISPDQEQTDSGPTKWRREGHDRRGEAAEKNVTSDMEKRLTGDRRAKWLEFIARIIFPKGSRNA